MFSRSSRHAGNHVHAVMLDPRRYFPLAALGDVSRSPGKIYLSIPSTTRRIDGFLGVICDRFTTIPLRRLAQIAAKLVNLGSDQTERTPGAVAPGVSCFCGISRFGCGELRQWSGSGCLQGPCPRRLAEQELVATTSRITGNAVGSTVTLCRAGIQHRVRMTGNQPGQDDLLPRPALLAERAA